MAEDNNDDVDRAIAVFSASPMRYFTPASTSPPSNAAQLSGGEALGSEQMKSDNAVAFPLLLAALPGLNQAPMPVPPIGVETGSSKPQTPASEAKKTELLTRRARALDRPVVSPAEMKSAQQHIRAPSLSAIFSLPVSHVGPQAPGQRSLRPHVASTGTTPMATMFQALHAPSPSHHEPAGTMPGLQDIFSRL